MQLLFHFTQWNVLKMGLDKPQNYQLFYKQQILGITDVQIKMQKGQQVQIRLESGLATIENKQEDRNS